MNIQRSTKLFYFSFDLSEREVKLYFGATFLSVPKNVFDDSDIETID